MSNTKIITLSRLVKSKFDGMKDKSGQPYVDHSFRVAEKAATFGRNKREQESLYVIGLCHDLFEDSNALAQDLREAGASDVEIEAVYNVSNKFNNGDKILPYEDFIERTIDGGFYSTVVKFVDVMDNLTRPKHDGFKYAEKLNALAKLSEAMKEHF